jgi:hypothetical protein
VTKPNGGRFTVAIDDHVERTSERGILLGLSQQHLAQ